MNDAGAFFRTKPTPFKLRLNDVNFAGRLVVADDLVGYRTLFRVCLLLCI